MTYEKPQVIKLGSLTELTQTGHIKQLGGSDGFFLLTDDNPLGNIS